MRMKEDVVPLDPIESLEKVLQLEPVSYTYRPGVGPFPSGRQRGLIAQDVVELLPETVHIQERRAVRGGSAIDNFHYLDYSRLVVDLIGALQATHEELQQTQDQVNDLSDAFRTLQEVCDSLQKDAKKDRVIVCKFQEPMDLYKGSSGS